MPGDRGILSAPGVPSAPPEPARLGSRVFSASAWASASRRGNCRSPAASSTMRKGSPISNSAGERRPEGVNYQRIREWSLRRALINTKKTLPVRFSFLSGFFRWPGNTFTDPTQPLCTGSRRLSQIHFFLTASSGNIRLASQSVLLVITCQAALASLQANALVAMTALVLAFLRSYHRRQFSS